MTIVDTPLSVLDQTDEAIFKFLWSGKIAKAVIQKEIEEGGLKMPNIYFKAKAWKMM